MEYYINPMWFYLADLSETIKVTFLVLGFTGIIGAILFCAMLIPDYYKKESDEYKTLTKKAHFFIVLSIVMALIGCVLPTSKACDKIIIASCLTKENVSDAKEETYEFIINVLNATNEKKDK